MLDEAKIMGNRPLCATALGTTCIDTTHCTTPNLGSRIRSSDLSFFDYPVPPLQKAVKVWLWWLTSYKSWRTGPDLQLLYDVHTTKATSSQLSEAVKCLILASKCACFSCSCHLAKFENNWPTCTQLFASVFWDEMNGHTLITSMCLLFSQLPK